MSTPTEAPWTRTDWIQCSAAMLIGSAIFWTLLLIGQA